GVQGANPPSCPSRSFPIFIG
ncbi:hypothetical protein CP8484711_1038B, partial [Chlamydia psittaci 84-8471/1]